MRAPARVDNSDAGGMACRHYLTAPTAPVFLLVHGRLVTLVSVSGTGDQPGADETDVTPSTTRGRRRATLPRLATELPQARDVHVGRTELGGPPGRAPRERRVTASLSPPRPRAAGHVPFGGPVSRARCPAVSARPSSNRRAVRRRCTPGVLGPVQLVEEALGMVLVVETGACRRGEIIMSAPSPRRLERVSRAVHFTYHLDPSERKT